MNWTDIVVLLILIISTITAYRMGFVKTCFNFFSTIISLIMAYKLYPIISRFLVDSNWFNNIKISIEKTMNMQEKVNELTLNAQTSFINDLELPNFLKSALVENNNIEIYNLFNVTNIQDYISSYIAHICINIIAMIGTFLIVLILLKIIGTSLDLVAKLPIINSVNKTVGAVLGLIKGILVVWILCILVTFFYSKPSLQPVLLAIQQSSISKIFYDNNWIVFMITKIFV